MTKAVKNYISQEIDYILWEIDAKELSRDDIIDRLLALQKLKNF